jgi:4-aminobutyrate aminotransferase-like enzyme
MGIDIVKGNGKPDPELASRIMNHMRENGVLIGITGHLSQVLKIRPPLVFEKEHADILLRALNKALNEL